MKRKTIAALGLLLSFANYTFAQGAGTGHKWYLGVDVGQSSLDSRHAALDDHAQFDNSSTSYAMRVGYHFSRYFALEAGYTDFGDFTGSVTPNCPVNPTVPCGPVDVVTSYNGISLDAMVVWPIAKHFQLNFSGGGIYRDYEGRATGPGATTHASENGTTVKFGAGIGVPINDRFDIGLNWTAFIDFGLAFSWSPDSSSLVTEGNSEVLSLGLRWRF